MTGSGHFTSSIEPTLLPMAVEPVPTGTRLTAFRFGEIGMKEKPLITVKEARKLLGKEAAELDDVEVMKIISLFTDTARKQLKKKRVKKSNNDLGL